MNIAFFGKVRIATRESRCLSLSPHQSASVRQLWEQRFNDLADLLNQPPPTTSLTETV